MLLERLSGIKMKRRKFINSISSIVSIILAGGFYSWQVRFNVRPEITVFELREG